MRLLLFTRPGCQLCGEARELLKESGREPEMVNIEGDVALLRDYAMRIPVVRREDTGEELGWPFDDRQLREFTAPRRG